ncbi:MAG: ABC transporter substrate-binding protein [Candidatus Nanopelagicales bacterium]
MNRNAHDGVAKRRVLAVAATTFAGALVLVGCTSTSSSTGNTSSAEPVESTESISAASSAGTGSDLTGTTPAANGPLDSITWNLGGGEPVTLDYSYTWDTSSGNMILANLCDNLMRQNPDLTYSPALASAVSQPDDLTYVYDLRTDVKFWDGTPMTADDVVFSLQRQLNPDVGSYWGVWFQNVESVEATSATQVTVKLKTPDVVFGQMMATSAGAVVKKSYVEEKGQDFGTPVGGVMCTGPYSIQDWSTGASMTLVANPDYWDSTLTPKVATIKLTFVRDPATVTNGLITGEIDGTWSAPISGLNQLRASSTGTVYTNTSTLAGFLTMASFEGPLGDVKIRQALQKSVDYQGITQGIMQSASTPAAAVVGSAYWGYASDTYAAAYAALPPAVQDLEAATALVQEAGAPTAPIVIAFDAGDTIAASVIAAVQDSASKAGLTVELKPLPVETFLSLFYDPAAREGIDAIYSTSTGDIPEPLQPYLQFVPSSPFNYTGFDNPGFTQPIEEARGVADPEARAALVTQAQASAAEIVQTFVPLYTAKVLLYMNNRVTGAPVNSLSALYYPWAATLGAP